MVNAEQEGHELNGTVHVGTRDDLAELAHLYRCTYPHATDANLARDIRPEEVRDYPLADQNWSKMAFTFES